MAEHVDLSKVSDADLEKMSNDVLRNLAQRVTGLERSADGPTPIGPYDKHTSSHTRNTIIEETAERTTYE